MARKPPRTSDSWFDKELVDLVDGLFESAARASHDGKRLFPVGRNNAPTVATVRYLFGITSNDLSCWRRGVWPNAADDKALRFAETLCNAFDLHGSSPESEAERALKVRRHWQQFCEPEHAEAVRRLREHRFEQERLYARLPFPERETGPETAADKPKSHSRSVPMALTRPTGRDPLRPDAMAKLALLAADRFGIVIEGRPRSGKRDLASAFAARHAQGRRLLWFRLAPTTAPTDLFARLKSLDDPLTAHPDESGGTLVDWLVASDTVLVLDGLDRTNHPSFSPLLRLSGGLPGPARLLATSLVKTHRAGSFEMPALTAAEVDEVFAQLAVDPGPGVAATVHAEAIPASAVRRAASLYGRVDQDTLSAVMEDRQTEMMERAPADLRRVVEVLQLLDGDFDRDALEFVVEALGIGVSPKDVLASLELLLIVTPSSAGTWRSEIRGDRLAPVTMSRDRLATVAEELADHYACRVEPGRRELTAEDCFHLYTAVRLLQIADRRPDRRRRLRQRFASAMERRGGFRRLVKVYRHEYADGEDDAWLPYRLAHAEFALGRYEEAWTVLNTAINRSLQTTVGRDETLHLSLLRLLAEVLIELEEPLLALKVLDKAIKAVKVRDLGATPCMQAVSCLSWALVRADMAEACIEVNRETLDRRFEGLAPPFASHVSNVRIGVALRALGDQDASIDALRKARTFFATTDARAYAWATLNLAISLDEAGRPDKAAAALCAALEINAAHDFFNGELQPAYERFLARADAYHDLAPALETELHRIDAREATRRDLVARVRAERVVAHVMIDLGASLNEPYVFELESYAIFSVRQPFPIASNFSRSMVRQHRKAGAEDTLDAIFVSTPPEQIFRTPIHNQVIADTCKGQPFLAKKYILPHRELIGRQSDSIIFFYARNLEAIGHADDAKALLVGIRNKTDFSYFNILANCLRTTSPGEALAANDEAYSIGNRQQQAQVLNNKAGIVLDHNLRQRFHEALDWCEEAVRLSKKPGFHWPRNNLLRLNLETCAVEDAASIVSAHRARFGPPMRVLREIVSKVQRRHVRDMASAELDR